ncbi:hypothetical protein FB475_6191 [Kribbella jejuensis]|uniref:Lipoprotein n=1 Tax=Kribbella jejuensis TaxID=236068 RepID=A0A542DU24_9ACTN|nr:hypothetical protein FB475_6191 [Kribbella jejuensis]
MHAPGVRVGGWRVASGWVSWVGVGFAGFLGCGVGGGGGRLGLVAEGFGYLFGYLFGCVLGGGCRRRV